MDGPQADNNFKPKLIDTHTEIKKMGLIGFYQKCLAPLPYPALALHDGIVEPEPHFYMPTQDESEELHHVVITRDQDADLLALLANDGFGSQYQVRTSYSCLIAITY
jgi:hypothetical protein